MERIMAQQRSAVMIVKIIFIALIILLLTLILFFMYAVLLPAMKTKNFSVEKPLFSDIELRYVVPEEDKTLRTDRHAVVLCSPDKKFAKQDLIYNPAQSCKLVNEVYESVNDCRFSCIGLGDCVKICPQEAIIIENSTAVVTSECCGCGRCIQACPKHIIALMPRDAKKWVLCNNKEKNLTSCSEYQKEKDIPERAKKHFKIWQTCYRILTRS